MKREQAILALKEKINYYESDKRLKAAIETLIPELAESEDERIRKELKEAFEAYDIESTWNGIPIRSIFAWLEKQKEQKPVPISCSHENGTPAEWSEEDEDMLNSCISSIEEAKENRYAYRETDGDTSYDHEISWLKSIRPSWKPSEEQIEALKAVIDSPTQYQCIVTELKTLYDELKKL